MCSVSGGPACASRSVNFHRPLPARVVRLIAHAHLHVTALRVACSERAENRDVALGAPRIGVYSTLCVVLHAPSRASSECGCVRPGTNFACAPTSGSSPRSSFKAMAYALEAMRVKARIFWQGPVDDHTHESDVQNGMPHDKGSLALIQVPRCAHTAKADNRNY